MESSAVKFDDEVSLGGARASTRTSYLEKLRVFIVKAREVYPNKSLEGLSLDEVKQVLLKLKRNYSSGSYRTIAIVTRKFYQVLGRREFEDLQSPRITDQALPDVLTRDEVGRLISGISDLHRPGWGEPSKICLGDEQ